MRCRAWNTMFALCTMPLLSHGSDAGSLRRLEQSDFGKLPDNTPARLFTLRNASGMSANIITYGAILVELQVPDRQGATTNVVLGTNTLGPYLKGFPAPSAIIGRVANRIGGAQFTLDGVTYRLSANNGPNHLHGVFSKVNWQAQPLPAGPHAAAVRLSYFSQDGEDGFPGNVRVSVTYSLTDDNELRLDYEAATDKATPINLTSHAYFNLAGHGDVLGHELWLAAERYTPTDDGLIPTGEIAGVKGTALDFTTPTRIGLRIEQLKPKPGGYDHNFVLDRPATALALAARVRDPVSGRVMEVRTTEPAVQLYTGNHLKHRAVCLETQHYPDSVNHPAFPSTILRPDQKFSSTTIFTFSVK